MAREHANIRLDMWGDADWRSLSRDAQWLYELLLTHPDTNRCGVSDWRPGRLARMASGTTAGDVRNAGAELASKFFVVIDEDSEEVLVRSYVKYDGVLKQPNLTITMANDWSGVASDRLRAVVALEVQRLRQSRPEMPGWKSDAHLQTLLTAPTLDIKADPSPDPSADPSGDPSPMGDADPSVEGPSTSTATSTTTSSSSKKSVRVKSKATPLPVDWVPTESHREFAQEHGLRFDLEVHQFKAHAEANGREQVSWNGAFATWLGNAVTRRPSPVARAAALSRTEQNMSIVAKFAAQEAQEQEGLTA